MSEELRPDGIAFNALWPRTGIATAAIQFALLGEEALRHCRTRRDHGRRRPRYLRTAGRSFTGNFLIDDTFLHAVGGVTDFEGYRVDRSVPLAPDFFVPDDSVPPPGVTLAQVSMLT